LTNRLVGTPTRLPGNDDERYRQGSTVSKLDPATNQVVGEPLALGSPQSIAFGHGSRWATVQTGELVRITPARSR
jgi:hypothetical protein